MYGALQRDEQQNTFRVSTPFGAVLRRLGVRRASEALAVYILYRLQCFDAAGWAAGRASGL